MADSSSAPTHDELKASARRWVVGCLAITGASWLFGFMATRYGGLSRLTFEQFATAVGMLASAIIAAIDLRLRVTSARHFPSASLTERLYDSYIGLGRRRFWRYYPAWRSALSTLVLMGFLFALCLLVWQARR